MTSPIRVLVVDDELPIVELLTAPKLLRTETARLTRLVNDLAEPWRAEARELTLHRDAVDLATVAREVGDRARDRPGARRGDGRPGVGREPGRRAGRDVPPGAARRLNAR